VGGFFTKLLSYLFKPRLSRRAQLVAQLDRLVANDERAKAAREAARRERDEELSAGLRVLGYKCQLPPVEDLPSASPTSVPSCCSGQQPCRDSSTCRSIASAAEESNACASVSAGTCCNQVDASL
jgi:hypothetical protein